MPAIQRGLSCARSLQVTFYAGGASPLEGVPPSPYGSTGVTLLRYSPGHRAPGVSQDEHFLEKGSRPLQPGIIARCSVGDRACSPYVRDRSGGSSNKIEKQKGERTMVVKVFTHDGNMVLIDGIKMINRRYVEGEESLLMSSETLEYVPPDFPKDQKRIEMFLYQDRGGSDLHSIQVIAQEPVFVMNDHGETIDRL